MRQFECFYAVEFACILATCFGTACPKG